MFCKHCGKDVGSAPDLCPFCKHPTGFLNGLTDGISSEAFNIPEPAEIAVNTPPEVDRACPTVSCVFCGSVFEADSLFCPVCGEYISGITTEMSDDMKNDDKSIQKQLTILRTASAVLAVILLAMLIYLSATSLAPSKDDAEEESGQRQTQSTKATKADEETEDNGDDDGEADTKKDPDEDDGEAPVELYNKNGIVIEKDGKDVITLMNKEESFKLDCEIEDDIETVEYRSYFGESTKYYAIIYTADEKKMLYLADCNDGKAKGYSIDVTTSLEETKKLCKIEDNKIVADFCDDKFDLSKIKEIDEKTTLSDEIFSFEDINIVPESLKFTAKLMLTLPEKDAKEIAEVTGEITLNEDKLEINKDKLKLKITYEEK